MKLILIIVFLNSTYPFYSHFWPAIFKKKTLLMKYLLSTFNTKNLRSKMVKQKNSVEILHQSHITLGINQHVSKLS